MMSRFEVGIRKPHLSRAWDGKRWVWHAELGGIHHALHECPSTACAMVREIAKRWREHISYGPRISTSVRS